MKKEQSKKYDPTKDARDFMPELVEKLKIEATEGSGIARTKAAELLVKLAKLDENEADGPIEVIVSLATIENQGDIRPRYVATDNKVVIGSNE